MREAARSRRHRSLFVTRSGTTIMGNSREGGRGRLMDYRLGLSARALHFGFVRLAHFLVAGEA